MSRRSWLGSSKGQFTSVETFFPTTWVTQKQRNTSVVVAYNTYYDTTYTTTFPTDYITIVPTGYVTTFPTSWLTPIIVPTITDYPVNTSRVTTTTVTVNWNTLYSQNTITTFSTAYTQFSPTSYITTFVTYGLTGRYTDVPSSTSVAIYRDTSYPTFYPPYQSSYPTYSPTSQTYPSVNYGCRTLDRFGNETGRDSAAPGCTLLSCSLVSSQSCNENYYTYYDTAIGNTTVPYPGITYYDTIFQTFEVFQDAGLYIDGYCYPAESFEAQQYCAQYGGCGSCTVTYTSYYNTSSPTSAPATLTTTYPTYRQTSQQETANYVCVECFNCPASCVTTYQTQVGVTSVTVPGYNQVTSASTFVRYSTYPVIRSVFTEFYTPLGNTSSPVPYVSEWYIPTNTTRSTVTQYYVNTSSSYPQNTTTTFSTPYPTSTDYNTTQLTTAPTSQVYPVDTAYPTSVNTTSSYPVQTSYQTSYTSTWVTTYPDNTTVTTSQTTTWFTQ